MNANNELEVGSIEYVGPHSTEAHLYEICLTLRTSTGARQERLRLVFRPAEATQLAHMLQRNPPDFEAEDQLASAIARLDT